MHIYTHMDWGLLALALELEKLISPSGKSTMRNNNISSFSLPFICSILLGLFTLVVPRECLGTQQSLLLQFKNSLYFPRKYSTKLVTWNESSDCCSWKGVTCEEGRVTYLDLSGEEIDARLDNSSSLFNLHNLKSLDLSFNSFSSTIPSRFGELTNLSHLNLAHAGFWGQIPIGISRLKSLVTLDLSSQYLSDGTSLVIPNLSMLVQNLSKLQELCLDGSDISTFGSGWCQPLSSSLPNLRVLSLSGCYVPGPLDESLGKLQSLSVVDLRGTNISSPIPQSFAKLSNLTHLYLSNCKLQGTFPRRIFQLPTLEIIDVSYNEFLQGTLPEFEINNSLREVSLSYTKFAGNLPTSLGNLWNLSILHLSRCKFYGTIPSSLSNLTQVVLVDLSSNNFTGPVPSFNLSTKLAHIDLSNNSLTGEMPQSLFAHPSLEEIMLSDNKLSGPIPEFKVASSLQLLVVDLSNNNLDGLIPTSFFKLQNLRSLCLSYNNFNGTKHLQKIQGSSKLEFLYLSNNLISGVIPKWIWEVGNGSLVQLDLSHNYLVGTLESFLFPETLEILDLHFNQLQGNIPVFPKFLHYIDLSSNNFTSLPFDNFHDHTLVSFFSLSNNSLAGDMSERICALDIYSLDLSLNNFSGRIPTCLIETSNSRYVLNLANNNFKGPIPDVFPSSCTLNALDLNGNLIGGEIPKSLSNCFRLELLDLGHNELIGEFPCLLKNLSTLRVLILRSNNLHGSIECPNANASWPMLQIFDIAHNNLNGELPRRWLSKLQQMMADGDDAHSEVLSFDKEISVPHLFERRSNTRYAYTVTVSYKGREVELPKILAIFTSIDLSRNSFHGTIPAELGQLQALHILNLSHNALGGQIPSSMGNLRQMESLDLSWNNLSGGIPSQLQSLSFLAFLNLSFNHLVGMIPTDKQFQTFSADSYLGNIGLCGFPLAKKCSDKAAGTFSSITLKDNRSDSGRRINWNLLSAEIGLLTGFGAVVAPLVFSRRRRIWYYERVDDIIIEIFPLAVSRKWFLWTAT